MILALWRCVWQAIGPEAFGPGEGSFWLPSQSSTVAASVDRVFYLIFWISLFFLALIVGLMIFFVIRYRARRGVAPEPATHHNLPLELTWSGIPLLLVIAIFYFGFRTFLSMSVAPQNAYEITVTAQKWKWLFTYANGYVDENLHVPVDTPVRLLMSSEDVIHSFFVPAFRVKKDVVPGRYTKAWFQATETGEFDIRCAEYCGTGHSDMSALVIVHEPGGFEKWLEQASNFLDQLSPAESGKRIFRTQGCSQCHTVDGTGKVGPTLFAVFGHRVVLRDGSFVVVDENYLRESILEPQAKVVAGFEPVMPTYQGRLAERELSALIAYLKTLHPAEEAE